MGLRLHVFPHIINILSIWIESILKCDFSEFIKKKSLHRHQNDETEFYLIRDWFNLIFILIFLIGIFAEWYTSAVEWNGNVPCSHGRKQEIDWQYIYASAVINISHWYSCVDRATFVYNLILFFIGGKWPEMGILRTLMRNTHIVRSVVFSL